MDKFERTWETAVMAYFKMHTISTFAWTYRGQPQQHKLGKPMTLQEIKPETH